MVLITDYTINRPPSIWDRIGDAIMNYCEPAEEHPIMFTLKVITDMIITMQIYETLFGDRGGSNTGPVDFNSLRESSSRELRELRQELIERRARQPQTALEYLKQSEDILSILEQEPRLGLMPPGFAEAMTQTREFSAQLRAAGQGAWDISTTRSFHSQVKSLQEEYLLFDEEWRRWKEQWEELHSRVETMVRNNRILKLPVNTVLGEEILEIDCDFWSHGELEQAAAELPPGNQPENTTIEAFRDLILRVSALEQRVGTIIQRAGQDFTNAQLRLQLAQSIRDQLENRGWWIAEEADFAFLDDDEREQLTLKLMSPAGDRLEFGFRPDNTMTLRPLFQNVHNRSIIEQLIRVLRQALSDNGVDISDAAVT